VLKLVLILTLHIIDTQRIATLTIVCEKLKGRTYLRLRVDWHKNIETDMKEVSCKNTV